MRMPTTIKLPALNLSSVLVTALALGVSACGRPEPGLNHPELSLEVVSGAPHLVTGGSTLLEAHYQGNSEPPEFLLNDQSVNWQTAVQIADDGSRTATTLATGLRDGENVIQAILEGSESQLTVVNYPITGPVISGEHQRPYLCLSDLAPQEDGSPRRFAIGNGEYLDTRNQNQDCSVDTRIDYVYRSQGSDGFKPLPETGALPNDVMMTENTSGDSVPFVVRLETGTINRAIYQIAILHDPRHDAPTAFSPSSAWNGRLVYTYGGGCEAGYFQGASTGGVLRESMLGLGYAVASSTLNVNAQGGCNDVLSAETTMMVKEHFTKYYGNPVHTIGRGGSGGAMQQLLIAGAYPGLLDGLLVSLTFSDAVTYFTDAQECSGPWRRYANNPENGLDEETRALIGGWPNWYLCDQSLGLRPDRISPFDCSAEIPVALHYHPEERPDGIRCSIYDGMRNIFGQELYSAISDTQPFARSPHDNVGVQYGLEALNAGLIGKSLFLDINEQFGGWNIDFQPTAERTEGDPQAIRAAYETGRITSGAGGLSRVPIIDDRLYLDDEGNFHASVYSFTTKARLERDNGHADNYVIRRHDRNVSLEEENLALMDQWLNNLKAADTTIGLPLLDRIVAARPAELQDDCFSSQGERIVEPAHFDRQQLFDNNEGRCNQLYPPHAGLRLVAGGPLSNDVMKCALKPIDYEDYQVEFITDEKARLESIFPEGVCDWDKPGMYQTGTETWLSFGPSPVNRYQP